MKSRPIIFSGPMVRAILAGEKTQTRRIINPQPYMNHDTRAAGDISTCPYGQPGDQLWVRETFMPMPHLNAKAFYRATDRLVGGKWKPSIFMPRDLSRIDLEVVAVRVERLQSITPQDAWKEGISADGWETGSAIHEFRRLWESINGAGSWDLNPWVWVVEFRRVEGGKA
jgi:hypothetical protein